MILVAWMKRYRARRQIIVATLKDVLLDCTAWPGTPEVSDIQAAMMLKDRLAKRGIAMDLDACLVEVECVRRKQRRREMQLQRQWRRQRRAQAVRR